jgi:CheY-like chemotaxis protein
MHTVARDRATDIHSRTSADTVMQGVAHMPHVLVVEDESIMKESLAVLLEGEGYTVQTVSNGLAALEALRAAPALPDVIVLDLMMPVMDGRQFLDEVQKIPALKRLKIVVLTALEAPVVQVTAIVRKPVNFDRFLHVIAEVLAQPVRA